MFDKQITDSFSTRFVPPTLDLSGSNLPAVVLNQMLLGGANFSGAHLPYCKALLSDLTAADFKHADMSACTLASTLDGASFENVNLEFATVSGKISHVSFRGAELGFSTWVGADFEFPREVQAAKNWALAFYKPSDLATLGLPADHNEKLIKLIQSRTPAANIEERVRLSLALENVQKAFQVLQGAKDHLGSLINSDGLGK